MHRLIYLFISLCIYLQHRYVHLIHTDRVQWEEPNSLRHCDKMSHNATQTHLARRWTQPDVGPPDSASETAKRLNKINNRVQRETILWREEKGEAPPGGWRSDDITVRLHRNTFYIELVWVRNPPNLMEKLKAEDWTDHAHMHADSLNQHPIIVV